MCICVCLYVCICVTCSHMHTHTYLYTVYLLHLDTYFMKQEGKMNKNAKNNKLEEKQN